MDAQMAFALDRVKALAPLHPEWDYTDPFQSVLDGDIKDLAESGQRGAVELTMFTHAGMRTDEFSKIVTVWLATARDPRFKRHYTELVYQPMLELLSCPRANGFKTFIGAGGGVEFIRGGGRPAPSNAWLLGLLHHRPLLFVAEAAPVRPPVLRLLCQAVFAPCAISSAA
jgi:hypothetical protein